VVVIYENEVPMPELSHDRESVYLADAEPHLPEPFRAAADLRARVILHVLFADALVLGDSQSLNNPYLRQLLTTEAGRPHDLAALIKDGHLRIARRSNVPSFLTIRNDHAEREVDNVPSPGYAAWLDDITGDHLIRYDGAEVAARFKSGFCDLLETQASGTDGLQRAVLRQAHDWVQEQDHLLYKGIRDWKNAYPDRTTAALLALRKVEENASRAYREALPSTLNTAVADRRSMLRVGRQARAGLAELQLPAALLSVSALSEVPIEVIQETLLLPSRRVALRELARIRHEDSAGQGLQEAVTHFAETFHELALQSASPAARSAVEWHDAKLRVALTMSERDGGHGAAFEVISGEGAPVPGFFELFSQSLPIATDDVIQPKEDLGADAVSRAVALVGA
jgi:histone H3/H4